MDQKDFDSNRSTVRYPVIVHKEKTGGCWLSFPDVPGALTCGTSVADAMSHALDALETMFMYTEKMIPMPSAQKRGQKLVELPPSVTAKVLLHNEMVNQKIRPIDLARRMG